MRCGAGDNSSILSTVGAPPGPPTLTRQDEEGTAMLPSFGAVPPAFWKTSRESSFAAWIGRGRNCRRSVVTHTVGWVGRGGEPSRSDTGSSELLLAVQLVGTARQKVLTPPVASALRVGSLGWCSRRSLSLVEGLPHGVPRIPSQTIASCGLGQKTAQAQHSAHGWIANRDYQAGNARPAPPSTRPEKQDATWLDPGWVVGSCPFADDYHFPLQRIPPSCVVMRGPTRLLRLNFVSTLPLFQGHRTPHDRNNSGSDQVLIRMSISKEFL